MEPSHAQIQNTDDHCETFNVSAIGRGHYPETASINAQDNCQAEVNLLTEALVSMGYVICETYVGIGVPLGFLDPPFSATCEGWVKARQPTLDEWIEDMINNLPIN